MSKLGNKTTKGVRSLSTGTKVLNMLDFIASKPRLRMQIYISARTILNN